MGLQEEARAEQVIRHAHRRLSERLASGESPRTDGLFDGEDDDALRLLEAGIQAAIKMIDARKVDAVGNLLAAMVIDDDVTIDDALQFVDYIEDLSWRQVVALVYFADASRDGARQLIAAAGEGGTGQIRPTCEAELSDLARTQELIGLKSPDDEGVNNPSNTWGGGSITASSLDKIRPTGPGFTLHRLAELDSVVTPEDLDSFEETELRP